MNLKYLFTYLFLLFSFFTKAQVGINVESPIETLEVDGKIKVRNIPENNYETYLFSIDENNIVKKIDKGLFTNSIEEKSITIGAGETKSIENNNQYDSASIIISTKNSCNKNMITSFISYLDALVFINGIAWDKITTAGIIPLATDERTDYSPEWKLEYDNLRTCNDVNAINNTEFNFILKRGRLNTNKYMYYITNNGNQEITYDLSFMKL